MLSDSGYNQENCLAISHKYPPNKDFPTSAVVSFITSLLFMQLVILAIRSPPLKHAVDTTPYSGNSYTRNSFNIKKVKILFIYSLSGENCSLTSVLTSTTDLATNLPKIKNDKMLIYSHISGAGTNIARPTLKWQK